MANIFKIFKKVKDFDDFLEMTKLDGILNKKKREQEELTLKQKLISV